MSGHVTYTCPCLNIKVHLASKYSLNNHVAERQQYWFQQEDPALEGWLLELGMGAVVVSYSSLIETRTSSTTSWMTVGCLNCNTDQVYSIRNKAATRNSSSGAAHTPCQTDESVVLHKDTLVGHQVDDVRHDDQFSDIFDIKLSDIASSSSLSLVNQNEVPDHLRAQHQELYQVLEKGLEKMRLASEVRIEQWKKVEMERLEKDSKKAREESNALWKKVLSVNQQPTHIESLDATEPRTALPPQGTPSSSTTTEPPAATMATESSPANIDSNSSDSPLEVKRSSQGIRFMDNVNDSSKTTLLGSYRRSSLSLNQSVVANGPSGPSHDVQSLLPADETDNTGSSDEEDMFDLDEELSSDSEQQQQQPEDQEADFVGKESGSIESSNASGQSIAIKSSINQKTGPTSYGSSWIKKKRLTGKYIDDVGNTTSHEDRLEPTDDNTAEDDISRSISAFATSMPININASMSTFLTDNDDNDTDVKKDNTNDEHTRSSMTIKRAHFPTKLSTTSYSFAPTKTTPSASFVGYDFSFSDRALSKQFADYAPERRKSVSAVSGRRHPPQLDALMEQGSLDTRSIRMKK
ncbi:hypothetical protein [Absidia glauca]|uniref:Uncharacterized protein n=1 Tax=Absidia glauca TaxID=4829 RepID=A0A163IXE6_ABSGL|nr:hypothetical protein [Absidia glauca]